MTREEQVAAIGRKIERDSKDFLDFLSCTCPENRRCAECNRRLARLKSGSNW